MNLCLNPVIVFAADVLAAEAAGVLQLQAALLIVPVLQADGQVRLVPAIYAGITVERLATGYDVEGIDHRDGRSDVAAA